MQTVTLSLFRFEGLRAPAWAFGQMQWAKRPLRRLAELEFFRLCGTGTAEGFNPRPNLRVFTLLAAWPSPEAARRGLADGAVFQRYRDRAAESWSLFLAPTRSWGRWGGVEPFRPDAGSARAGEPIVALTRAQVKMKWVPRFWSRVPDIGAAVRRNGDVLFQIGMGERPWLNQVTFSIWPNDDSIQAFARAPGPHRAAIDQVRRHQWFHEELYARFALIDAEGSWSGAETRVLSRREAERRPGRTGDLAPGVDAPHV